MTMVFNVNGFYFHNNCSSIYQPFVQIEYDKEKQQVLFNFRKMVEGPDGRKVTLRRDGSMSISHQKMVKEISLTGWLWEKHFTVEKVNKNLYKVQL